MEDKEVKVIKLNPTVSAPTEQGKEIKTVDFQKVLMDKMITDLANLNRKDYEQE